MARPDDHTAARVALDRRILRPDLGYVLPTWEEAERPESPYGGVVSVATCAQCGGLADYLRVQD